MKKKWMVSGLSILMMVTGLWNAWFQNLVDYVMWLHYLRWYSSAIVNDDVSLEEQMPSPPVVPATTYSHRSIPEEWFDIPLWSVVYVLRDVEDYSGSFVFKGAR